MINKRDNNTDEELREILTVLMDAKAHYDLAVKHLKKSQEIFERADERLKKIVNLGDLLNE